ncbi:hypothetical protein [Uliginosibacterium gangwonense]|uniref:hypothetical protein n=1 Tax=Uliginosibacterium gangwonense TaxID=392736 RepID=UPI0003604F3A|nr:hypothetical protein [Uliginosibacterium gangwonense]
MDMNRRPIQVAILSLAFVCSGAFAQSSGLRLTPQFGVYENPIGLKLRLINSRSPLFSVPADNYLAPPVEHSSQASNRASTALIGDWQLNASGLRASAGLVLRYKVSTLLGEENRRQDVFQSSPETYIGLGWSTEPFGAKSWRFSADVGSFVSTRSRNISSMAQGLQPDGTGIRWTPYLSIGAQFNY